MGAGIDYGLGKSNIDAKTGIRYGVISQHSLGGFATEDIEYDYAKGCPDCGSDAVVPSRSARYEWYCQACKTWHANEDVWSDEPIGFHYDGAGYILIDCLDSDVMVILSPNFTHAQFCSPCVPGAGNLDSPDANGAKAYCLGHDWFDEDNPCPYPVYRVSDGSLVERED